ncbi:MAG TPA: hypothetical protein VFR93_10285 [Candidatus Limnocylindrales bacterium]|nr:hypothetical protein [Candidatus Limnocylindrales bacterium]
MTTTGRRRRTADPAAAEREPTGDGRSTARSRRRLALAGLAFGIAGFVLGAVALGMVLAGGGGSDRCRQAAWSALPGPGALPTGWKMSGSGIYVDSVGTTLTGPAPSASDQPAPAIFVSVGCYGPDAHEGVLRSHVVALADGATDIAFPRLGDESFATHDAASGEYSVTFRRGSLVATLAAPETTEVDALSAAATAVDSAMAAGPTSAGALPTGSLPGPSAAASTAPSGGPGASASGTPHVAPDLEKLLPSSVAGATLVRSSFHASDVLGNDPSSQALATALAALGKKTADLQIAEAYDPAHASDWYVDAFRLPGVGGPKLAPAILTGWLGAGSSGTKSSSSTIGGKKVTHLDRGTGTPGDWVYVRNDVVFDVAASDVATATRILATLP